MARQRARSNTATPPVAPPAPPPPLLPPPPPILSEIDRYLLQTAYDNHRKAIASEGDMSEDKARWFITCCRTNDTCRRQLNRVSRHSTGLSEREMLASLGF